MIKYTVAALGLLLCSTVQAKELFQVTCIFNGETKVYSTDVDDVTYYDYGIRIDLKDGTIIRYGQNVPCEYKKVFVK